MHRLNRPAAPLPPSDLPPGAAREWGRLTTRFCRLFFQVKFSDRKSADPLPVANTDLPRRFRQSLHFDNARRRLRKRHTPRLRLPRTIDPRRFT